MRSIYTADEIVAAVKGGHIISKQFEVDAPVVISREVLERNGQEPADNVLAWTLSSESRDRDHDIIKVSGWQLANYRKNPVVLWGHKSSDLPIGRALQVWRDSSGGRKRLRGLLKFTEQDENPFGYMVFRLAVERYLRTSSVGFIGQKAAPDPDDEWGYIFSKQELLENSVVSVPSNPEALQEAKSIKGIDISPYAQWTEKVLDMKIPIPGVDPKTVEQVRSVVVPPQPTIIVPESPLDDELKSADFSDDATEEPTSEVDSKTAPEPEAKSNETAGPSAVVATIKMGKFDVSVSGDATGVAQVLANLKDFEPAAPVAAPPNPEAEVTEVVASAEPSEPVAEPEGDDDILFIVEEDDVQPVAGVQ